MGRTVTVSEQLSEADCSDVTVAGCAGAGQLMGGGGGGAQRWAAGGWSQRGGGGGVGRPLSSGRPPPARRPAQSTVTVPVVSERGVSRSGIECSPSAPQDFNGGGVALILTFQRGEAVSAGSTGQ